VATISYPKKLDGQELAGRIKGWLDLRGFETELFGSDGAYLVKGRKSSVIRAVLAADRALDVRIGNGGATTEVVVGQGSWTTNVVSNTIWFAVTGGANLAISGWSIVIQKQLEAFIRQTMEEMVALQTS
jgi:hypothetical protein